MPQTIPNFTTNHQLRRTHANLAGTAVAAAIAFTALPAHAEPLEAHGGDGHGSEQREPVRPDGAETQPEETYGGEMTPAHFILPTAHLAGAFALKFAAPFPNNANFTGGILFDDAVYDSGFIRDPDAFKTMGIVGDVGFFTALGWSAVDPLSTAFVDADRALEMAWMNIEAYATFASILYVSQHLVRRERPNTTRFCSSPDDAFPEYDVDCDNPGNNRSFVGGHTGVAATAATLTCLHHAQGIYGGVADAVPCLLASAGVGVTFASRTMVGAHYFSDNALGLGVGVLSGMMPYFLHYAWQDAGDRTETAAARRKAAANGTPTLMSASAWPTEGGNGLQLGLVGAL